MRRCLETDWRVVWKFSAMAFGVIACNAIKVIIARLVGSAIAWKMSRLMLFKFLIAQLISCKYMRNYSVSQIYFLFFLNLSCVRFSSWVEVAKKKFISQCWNSHYQQA